MFDIQMIDDLQEQLDALKKPPFHILLVDDQAIIAAAIRNMLNDDPNFELHHCDKGADAIRVASQLNPTVILQDLIMPDMDGLQLVKYYQRIPATQDIPIIVLSSKEDGEVKAQAFEAGANDYLVKLPNKIELLARLRYHSRTRLERMELQLALKELERISTTDGLTKIANRRYFNSSLEKEWKLAQRQKQPLSIAMMDIDFFKQYNDHYGHQAGDDCLLQVAASLKASLKRPADMVARYGGEEFVAIFPNTPIEGAELIADALRQHVQDLQLKHDYATDAGCVTISIGVACMLP
ncbi:MAG: diguanylate cyclase, partial [Mariprofundaceae bacterium]|nr:diguanylate cyclase [Mariprofundaceae bacterium]